MFTCVCWYDTLISVPLCLMSSICGIWTAFELQGEDGLGGLSTLLAEDLSLFSRIAGAIPRCSLFFGNDFTQKMDVKIG